MSSPSTGTTTPSSSTDPPTHSASTYLSYPVSQVVSGLYRRITDSSPNRLPKFSSFSASISRSQSQIPHRSTERGTAATDPSTSDDRVYTPPNRNVSPFQPPPLTPLSLTGASGIDTILTKAIAEEIRLLVPPRLQLAEQWRLVYSLERDGVSLGTLYKKCADIELPGDTSFVLVVQDGVGGIFGAYLTDPPAPHSGYYGTGECFLWRASLLSAATATSHLLANLPPPPSAPESETKEMGRSTTIASPTSPRNRTSFSEKRRRRSSAAAAAAASINITPSSPPKSSSTATSNAATTPYPHNSNTNLSPPPSSSSLSQPSSTSEIASASSLKIPSPSPSPSPSTSASTSILRFKAFPYSGINDYLILCDTHYLSVGGGDGRYGLWLDEVLEQGVSQGCLTFGNEGLSDEADANDADDAKGFTKGLNPPSSSPHYNSNLMDSLDEAVEETEDERGRKGGSFSSSSFLPTDNASGRGNYKTGNKTSTSTGTGGGGKFEVVGVEIWGVGA